MTDPHTGPLTGTWYVVRTSLPLWRGRHDPSVTYAALPGGALLDIVRSTRNGKPALILGLDTPDPRVPGGFVWRGRSLLTRRVTSRWRLLHHEPGQPDPAAELAVTLFARTPFTPAGLDVYARVPRPDGAAVAALLDRLGTIPEARPFLPRLFAPLHPEAPVRPPTTV